MSWRCPQCAAPLSADDLRPMRLECPRCKTELQVFIMANWVYGVLAFGMACAIATIQGHESIIFAFYVILYTTIILVIIKVHRFELRLPMRIEEVPNSRLWPIVAPDSEREFNGERGVMPQIEKKNDDHA